MTTSKYDFIKREINYVFNYYNFNKLIELKLLYLKRFTLSYLSIEILDYLINLERLRSYHNQHNKQDNILERIEILLRKYKDKHEYYTELNFDPYRFHFPRLFSYHLKNNKYLNKEYLKKISQIGEHLTFKEFQNEVSKLLFNGNLNNFHIIENSFKFEIIPVLVKKNLLLYPFKKKTLITNLRVLFEHLKTELTKKYDLLKFVNSFERHLINNYEYCSSSEKKILISIREDNFDINKLIDCEKVLIFFFNTFLVRVYPKYENIIYNSYIHFENREIYLYEFLITLDYINYFKIFGDYERYGIEKSKNEKKLLDYLIEHDNRMFNFISPKEIKLIGGFLKNTKYHYQIKEVLKSILITSIMKDYLSVKNKFIELKNHNEIILVKNFVILKNEDKNIIRIFGDKETDILNFLDGKLECLKKIFEECETKIDLKREFKTLNDFIYSLVLFS